jgi:hypothetical protein
MMYDARVSRSDDPEEYCRIRHHFLYPDIIVPKFRRNKAPFFCPQDEGYKFPAKVCKILLYKA